MRSLHSASCVCPECEEAKHRTAHAIKEKAENDWLALWATDQTGFTAKSVTYHLLYCPVASKEKCPECADATAVLIIDRLVAKNGRL